MRLHKINTQGNGARVNRLRFCFLSLCLCTLLACGDGSLPLSPLAPGARVLAFGDSLTAGYGAPEAQSYPAVLAQLAVLDIVNAGVSGELSANGLDRLPALLAQHSPQLVILCHAGNDLLRSTGIGTAKANLLEMIDLIRGQGAEVLLLGVPQPGVFLSTADFYDEIANETGVAYLPDVITDVLRSARLKSDAAHPNATGYQVIAEGVYDYLLDANAI